MTDAPAVLLVHSLNRAYALPLGQVAEIMRRLPTEALAGAPAHLLGLSIIRGEATPVVDLAALMGDPQPAAPGMLALVRSDAEADAEADAPGRGGRAIALAVERVAGVGPRPAAAAGPLGGPAEVAVGAQGLVLPVDVARDVAPRVWPHVPDARPDARPDADA